jgi:hypothetical protein
MRFASVLPAALAVCFSASFSTAQEAPPKAIAEYGSYSISLAKPQTVLVFAYWSTGDLALISPSDSALPILPSGISRFPILRDGIWIAGGPPKPYSISNGPGQLSCSPQQGLLNEVRQSQSPTELPRWCMEVSSGMTMVFQGMKRPSHLLVLGTDPIATPVLIRQALAHFKLRGNAQAAAADLTTALERSLPGTTWWSAITR